MCAIFLMHIDALDIREVSTLLYVLQYDVGFSLDFHFYIFELTLNCLIFTPLNILLFSKAA